MTKLENIERRINSLLEGIKGMEEVVDDWDRIYNIGYIAALEQIQNIIKKYK